MIGSDRSKIDPENIANKNETTLMKSFGCLLGNFMDGWREKITQFVSWNNTKTDNKAAMQHIQAEAKLDAMMIAPQNKKN